jgi:arabinose-5-phosphate isomerase
MTEKRFGCVGVVGPDGGLAGIITDGDLRRHIDGLFRQTAGEVMTPEPKTAPPAMLAAEALKKMTETAPSSTVLFVVEDTRPVGILHIHDLVRAGVI